MLVPALNRGTADAMRERKFALADASIVGFKYFKTIRLGSPQTRAGPWKLMAEVTVTTQAVVLG